jgi:hypothetical protein
MTSLRILGPFFSSTCSALVRMREEFCSFFESCALTNYVFKAQNSTCHLNIGSRPNHVFTDFAILIPCQLFSYRNLLKTRGTDRPKREEDSNSYHSSSIEKSFKPLFSRTKFRRALKQAWNRQTLFYLDPTRDQRNKKSSKSNDRPSDR